MVFMVEKRKEFLPYGTPWIIREDIEAAREVLESGFLTLGPRAREFEEKLASYIGVKYAAVVSNGTAALEIAVRSLGIGEGDSLVTTPLTFAATANAALFNRAGLDLVDIDRETYNMDAGLLDERISEQTRAVLPVHFAGRCCEMQEIGSIAKKHGLVVIEDAAHALGAEFEGRKAGSLGNAGCFSFHPVKHVAMGEGGAIATDDREVIEKARLFRWHGIDRNNTVDLGNGIGYGYDVKELSRNYRVSDVACALALSQFRRLEEFLRRRQEIASRYNEAFSGLKGIEVPKEGKGGKHAWHIYCPLFEERDRMFRFLREQNIEAQVHYIPIYRHSLYRKMFGFRPGDFPNCEYVFRRILTLPLFPKMSDQDVEYVIAKVKEGLKVKA